MAIGDAYATAATYRGLLSKTDVSEDAEILDDLTAVSRIIDRRLGRFFTKDTAVVTRIYDPRVRDRSLLVDDIADTTGLVIKVDTNRDGSFADETAFGATDYQLWPLNAARGPEPRPWNILYIPAWSTKDLWNPGRQVQLTAINGWPAVPKAIERATCHLTGILRVESPRATGRVPEDIEAAFEASPTARHIIGELMDSYGRWDFA